MCLCTTLNSGLRGWGGYFRGWFFFVKLADFKYCCKHRRSRQALGVHVERQRDGIQLLGTIRQQVILRCNLHSRKPEGLQTRIWTALT